MWFRWSPTPHLSCIPSLQNFVSICLQLWIILLKTNIQRQKDIVLSRANNISSLQLQLVKIKSSVNSQKSSCQCFHQQLCSTPQDGTVNFVISPHLTPPTQISHTLSPSLSLSILAAIFLGERWLAGWYQNVSILDFIGAKVDVGGSDNWSYKMCKAPVKSTPSDHLLQAGCPSCHPTNSVRALNGNHISRTTKHIHSTST